MTEPSANAGGPGPGWSWVSKGFALYGVFVLGTFLAAGFFGWGWDVGGGLSRNASSGSVRHSSPSSSRSTTTIWSTGFQGGK